MVDSGRRVGGLGGARRIDRRTRRPGQHRRPRPRGRTAVRAHRGPAEPRCADLPPARDAAQAVRPRPHRAQRRALRDLGAHRRDQGRLVGRHRRRHRRAVLVLGQGSTRDAERPRLRRRPRRAAVEGRLIPRTAYLHAAARGGRADQRVQLSGVGVAREIRSRVPRRHADARQARHADGLPGGGVRAHPRRVGPAARGLAPDRERQRADPVRPPAPRRPRGLHRQRLHRRDAARPRLRADRRGALHERDRLDQRLDPRRRRDRGNAGVRRVRPPARDRDDLEGRAEVHRDPAGARARGIRRRPRRQPCARASTSA